MPKENYSSKSGMLSAKAAIRTAKRISISKLGSRNRFFGLVNRFKEVPFPKILQRQFLCLPSFLLLCPSL